MFLNLHFSYSFSNLSGCNCVLVLDIVISIVEDILILVIV